MEQDKSMRKISAMYRWSGGTDYRHTCSECDHCIQRKAGSRLLHKCMVYGDTGSAASDWKPSYIACKNFNGPLPDIPVIRISDTGAGSEDLDGQMSIFDFLEPELPKRNFPKILSIGDRIGRVVLGECRIATITEVEGLPNYPFYRTDSGCCYSAEEGTKSIEELLTIAEAERRKCKTIVPQGLSERITVEYKPRECDGKILWAQIGIFENMLFWKEDVTYQFLEPYENEKELIKAYNKRKKTILENKYAEYRILEEEKPMRRLYWSIHGFYADAEYVKTNG